MRDIDEAIGPSDEWPFLTAADLACGDDAEDDAFDRWLASLPEGGVDHVLSELLDDHAGAPSDRRALQWS
jgi:hypothetical protein